MSSNRKVSLVTGATGFVGKHLTKELHAAGHYVICLSRQDKPPEDIRHAVDEWHKYDFTTDNPKNLNIKKNIDCLFHLSATVSETKNLSEMKERYLSDIIGPLTLIDHFKNRLGHICFFSSTSVYNIKGVYSLSKSMFEDALCMVKNRYGIPISCLRISSVYGPGMPQKGAIFRFIHDVKKGKNPNITCDARSKRNYIFVKDIAPAAIKITNKNLTGNFNIASNTPLSMLDVVREIGNCFNVTPVPIIDTKISKQLDITIDISRPENEIDFRPTSFQDGIKETVECIF